MLKRLLISFFAVFILLFSIAPSAANAQWYNQDPVLWYKQVYDDSNPSEIFGERYTAAQVDWIIMSFLTWPTTKFAGTEATKCFLEAIVEGTSDLDSCMEMSENLLDVVTRFRETFESFKESTSPSAQSGVSLIASKIINNNNDISGIAYSRNKLKNMSIISTAQAQVGDEGFGYTRLEGIVQRLWKTSRDTAYALFVVVTIILAFMIMFRVKTSPQTVITVQSAIPKIAIALILATFSFAIAGFAIDLMYVIIGVISIIFGPIIPNGVFNIFGDDISITFNFLTNGIAGLGVFGFLIFDLFAYPITFVLAMLALPEGIGNILVLFPGANPLATAFIGFAVFIAIIFFIILLIALAVIHIKIIIMLLKTTTNLLLLIIVSPIQIALGTVIPGLGFGTWFKNILANLSVFPVVGFLFTLSYIFLSESFAAAINGLPLGDELFAEILGVSENAGAKFGDGWPPLLGSAGDPAPLILLFVSVMLLFLAPKSAEIIKGVITGRGFAMGSAIGEAIGPAGTVGAFGTGILMQKHDAIARIDPSELTSAGYIGTKATNQFFNWLARQRR